MISRNITAAIFFAVGLIVSQSYAHAAVNYNASRSNLSQKLPPFVLEGLKVEYEYDFRLNTRKQNRELTKEDYKRLLNEISKQLLKDIWEKRK